MGIEEILLEYDKANSIIPILESIKRRTENDGLYSLIPAQNRLGAFCRLIRYSTVERDLYIANNILKRPRKFETLPYINLTLDDVNYTIFGFFHGFDRRKHFLRRLSPELSLEIRAIILSWQNPDDRKDAFYEEDASFVLDLDKDKEILDISQFIPSKKEQKLSKNFDLPAAFKNFYSDIRIILKTNLLKNNSNYYKLHYLGNKALKSMHYQGKTGELYLDLFLREPLFLELEYVSEKAANTKLSNVKRSHFTANMLLEKAKSGNLNNIAYFGGLAHMSQIAYFLKNPDYSFNALDCYIKEGFIKGY